MMSKVTGLFLLVCVVSGLMWGATDGKKYQNPIPVNPDTSAPDAWGYTWVRSTDPGGPTFNWVDITTRGTLVTGLGDDNFVGTFPIQFQFPYYWYNVDRFYIGSNAYINFSSPGNFAHPFSAVPSTTPPNDMLAVLAGDLDFTVVSTNPRCYYWTNAVDSLVVSWIDVTEFASPANPNLKHTCQVILRKQDSSIVFQYGAQQGVFNQGGNDALSIGIENQTGQIGLNYGYSRPGPHPHMPVNGLAIRFKRTVNTGVQITDAGIVGGLNATNLARMIPAGVADTIKCVVKNFGTASVTNAPVRYAITRVGQPAAYDTVIVPSLASGQEVNVTFPRLFTPAVAGPYSALFNVTVAGDVGPGNNSKTAELASVAFNPIGQTNQLAHESGALSTQQSWTGGGGFGVAFDLPSGAYPVRIESVYVNLSVAGQPMTVQILDGSSGAPGAILAQRVVSAVTGWNNVNFASDSVRVLGGRFFVGASGVLTFYHETTVPISNRTWEYTNGWAPYRSGDVSDAHIRAVVRREPRPSYSWAAQTSGITTYLYSVDAVSPSVAWAAGAAGVVRRTTNGGTTWTGVGGGAIGTADIYNIDALDANTAFVTTTPAAPAATFIYRTTNGGTTWTQVYTDASAGAFIDAIKMIDATTGFAVGDPVATKWVVLKTTDGGATWARIPTEPNQVGTEAGTQNCLSIVGASNLWFTSTQGGRVYRSTNAGATWSTGLTSFPAPSNVWFNNTSNGIVTSSGNFVARSADGGATWTNVTPSGTGFLIACGGFGATNLFYARGTTMYRSQDAGQTFATSYVGTGTYVGLSFVKQGQLASGWAVTSTGGIASFSTTLSDVTGPQGPDVPATFALMQNYPNPFNPNTTIQFALPVASDVTLKIYNVLGQEVATLVDGRQEMGSFQAVWNGRNSTGNQVASGIYFYNLTAKSADGNSTFTNFKKMLLLK